MEFCGFKSDVLFCRDFKFEILDYNKYGITIKGHRVLQKYRFNQSDKRE